MNSLALTAHLKEYALSHGIDLIGITSAKPFIKRKEMETSIDPKELLEDARSVIVTAFYMNETVVDPVDDKDNPKGRFTYGYSVRAYSSMERHCTKVIKDFLKKQGYRTVCNKRYKIPDKMAAARAGIGKYGKNSLILTREYGSCVMFVTLITNAPLGHDDGDVNTSDCGKCDFCLQSCPTGALHAPYKVNRKLCITDWLWGAFVPIPLREKQGNRLFGCGECVKACPRNKKLVPRTDYPVVIEDIDATPDLLPLVTGNKDHYRKALARFPMLAGVDAIRGNAIIALGNLRAERAAGSLVVTLAHPKPRIRAYSAWALGKIGGTQAERALRKALKDEEDQTVRRDIEYALEKRPF